jgi:hypothetical protein
MSDHTQFDFRKIIKFFTKEEVKTPLSFFFKVVPYLVAALIAILYAPISEAAKYRFFAVVCVVLGGLCLLVGVIAILWPKSLVYGEAGHRAERKLEFGTEERVIEEGDLDLLQNTENPRRLKGGTE